MKIHVVKKGDTLYELSKKYNVDLEKIIEFNPQITDPDKIDVGMKVKIPTPPVVVELPESTYAYKHVVKQGDTLWKLAKAHGVSLEAVIKANPQLKNPNVLLTGETVYIPKKETVQEPSSWEQGPPKKALTAPIMKEHVPELPEIAPLEEVKEEKPEKLPEVLPLEEKKEEPAEKPEKYEVAEKEKFKSEIKEEEKFDFPQYSLPKMFEDKKEFSEYKPAPGHFPDDKSEDLFAPYKVPAIEAGDFPSYGTDAAFPWPGPHANIPSPSHTAMPSSIYPGLGPAENIQTPASAAMNIPKGTSKDYKPEMLPAGNIPMPYTPGNISPFVNIPSVSPLANVPPVSPFANVPPVSPFANVPPVSPFANIPPVSPFANIPPVSPFANIPPVSPFANIPPVSPFANIPPVSPFANIPPVSPFANIPPVSPFANIPPVSPLAAMPIGKEPYPAVSPYYKEPCGCGGGMVAPSVYPGEPCLPYPLFSPFPPFPPIPPVPSFDFCPPVMPFYPVAPLTMPAYAAPYGPYYPPAENPMAPGAAAHKRNQDDGSQDQPGKEEGTLEIHGESYRQSSASGKKKSGNRANEASWRRKRKSAGKPRNAVNQPWLGI